MSTKHKITIGADPEFFIAKTDGKTAWPACGIFGGTKGKTVPIPGLESQHKLGYGLQEDNVMLEFNIPPQTDAYSFDRSIRHAVEYLQVALEDKGYRLLVGCEYTFTTATLLDFPKAMEFGCSPDYNAYADGEVFPKPDPTSLVDKGKHWRFAGGHIHLGGYNTEIPHFVMANFFDIAVMLPLMTHGYQCSGLKRKTLYGQAGRFRPTSFGIEYRTPSNSWIFNNHERRCLAQFVINLAKWTHETSLGDIQEAYQNVPWALIPEIIAKGKSHEAAVLVAQNFLKMPESMNLDG